MVFLLNIVIHVNNYDSLVDLRYIESHKFWIPNHFDETLFKIINDSPSFMEHYEVP